MKKLFTATTMLLFTCGIFAQVGIGTTTPTAELEINATTSLPALELNPQTTPVGTAMGQLSVIGDKLFMYDEDRGKWLTIGSTMLNFGLENGTDNQFLEYVGDITTSGPKMPLAGTIVYIAMNSAGGQADKQVQLYFGNTPIPNDLEPSIDGVIALSGNTFTNSNFNLDFEAGDYFRIKVLDEGSDVEELSVLLWIKWRQ